jgi:hypothetical protein
VLKLTQLLGKFFEHLFKKRQGRLRVNVELGKGMPLRKSVYQMLHGSIMLGGEQLFENWNSTLTMENMTVSPMQMNEECKQTCNISSKSRTANLFISEVLFANIRMTPLPNVGTWRNLSEIES